MITRDGGYAEVWNIDDNQPSFVQILNCAGLTKNRKKGLIPDNLVEWSHSGSSFLTSCSGFIKIWNSENSALNINSNKRFCIYYLTRFPFFVMIYDFFICIIYFFFIPIYFTSLCSLFFRWIPTSIVEKELSDLGANACIWSLDDDYIIATEYTKLQYAFHLSKSDL